MEDSMPHLPHLTERAIRAFYKLDFTPLLDAISPDCLFTGAASDIYHGLEEMLDDMDNIRNVPTFSMLNQKFELVDTKTPGQAIVFGEYDLEVGPRLRHAPRGSPAHHRLASLERRDLGDLLHPQLERMERAGSRRDLPTFMSKQTFRYLRKILKASAEEIENRRRVPFNVDGSTMLVNPDAISYVESAGKQSVLHLADRTITVNAMLGNVADSLPPEFLRTHRYYLVNAASRRIERNRIEMPNGDALPVPERRAKEVREALTSRMSAN